MKLRLAAHSTGVEGRQDSHGDERVGDTHSGFIEKALHPRCFNALHVDQSSLSADMIPVLKQGNHGLIACRIFVETRDALFNHLAKSRAYFESAEVIFWGWAIERHRELPLRFAQAGRQIFKSPWPPVILTMRNALTPDYADAELE
ncbi:MAG TPA: hypothetical protein VGI45_15975 [Terracidiphilus sp.]|jgi:hypothetical protein